MPGPTGFSPLPTIRQIVSAQSNAESSAESKAESNAESNASTQHKSLILRPRRLARPVLVVVILPVLHRYGPADTRASQEVQHSWAALFFNNELGYLGLPFPLLGFLPDLCPKDSLLGFPLLAALE